MAEMFRVALSGDFRKADGSPTYPDFDLGPLRAAKDVEIAFLESANPLRGDQLEDFDALILLAHRFTAESVPTSGGAPKVLASNIEGQSLATDGVNVYWAVNNGTQETCGLCGPPPPPTSTDSTIYSLPVGGGTPTVVATSSSVDDSVVPVPSEDSVDV